MKLRKISEAIRHENSLVCTAYEYQMPTRELDSAVIEITGRYPESGWVMNTACTSLVHIIKGEGHVISEAGSQALEEDGQLLIEKGEKYAFEGTMKLLFSAAPAWSSDQVESVQ